MDDDCDEVKTVKETFTLLLSLHGWHFFVINLLALLSPFPCSTHSSSNAGGGGGLLIIPKLLVKSVAQ